MSSNANGARKEKLALVNLGTSQGIEFSRERFLTDVMPLQVMACTSVLSGQMGSSQAGRPSK